MLSQPDHDRAALELEQILSRFCFITAYFPLQFGMTIGRIFGIMAGRAHPTTRKDHPMTPQHFLVPLDFSDYSTQALNYAMELAHKLQARLTLLHVIQSLSMGGDDMGVTLPYSYLQDLDAELNRRLESYLERVMAAGLNGDKVIVHGSPYQEIVEIAKARQVDLIIMGTHGRTGLRHMLMGSVAEKVVQLASCPVLVTRQPADVARSGSLPPLPRNR